MNKEMPGKKGGEQRDKLRHGYKDGMGQKHKLQ